MTNTEILVLQVVANVALDEPTKGSGKALASLRRRGLVSNGKQLRITRLGKKVLGSYEDVIANPR